MHTTSKIQPVLNMWISQSHHAFSLGPVYALCLAPTSPSRSQVCSSLCQQFTFWFSSTVLPMILPTRFCFRHGKRSKKWHVLRVSSRVDKGANMLKVSGRKIELQTGHSAQRTSLLFRLQAIIKKGLGALLPQSMPSGLQQGNGATGPHQCDTQPTNSAEKRNKEPRRIRTRSGYTFDWIGAERMTQPEVDGDQMYCTSVLRWRVAQWRVGTAGQRRAKVVQCRTRHGYAVTFWRQNHFRLKITMAWAEFELVFSVSSLCVTFWVCFVCHRNLGGFIACYPIWGFLCLAQIELPFGCVVQWWQMAMVRMTVIVLELLACLAAVGGQEEHRTAKVGQSSRCWWWEGTEL